MEKNNNSMAYISIIAIVAVVGIIGLIMMMSGGTTKQATPMDFSIGGENLAGDARFMMASEPSRDIIPTSRCVDGSVYNSQTGTCMTQEEYSVWGDRYDQARRLGASMFDAAFFATGCSFSNHPSDGQWINGHFSPCNP
jgi:hypothetical protein